MNLNHTAECSFNNPADAHGWDAVRAELATDEAPTAYVGVWLNERATPVGNRAGDDYFEGTAEELAAHFDGEVQVKTGMGVRLAIPCGPDCLKQAGCWTYRSYFPAS